MQKKRTNEQAEVQDQGKEEQGEKCPRERRIKKLQDEKKQEDKKKCKENVIIK